MEDPDPPDITKRRSATKRGGEIVDLPLTQNDSDMSFSQVSRDIKEYICDGKTSKMQKLVKSHNPVVDKMNWKALKAKLTKQNIDLQVENQANKEKTEKQQTEIAELREELQKCLKKLAECEKMLQKRDTDRRKIERSKEKPEQTGFSAKTQSTEEVAYNKVEPLGLSMETEDYPLLPDQINESVSASQLEEPIRTQPITETRQQGGKTQSRLYLSQPSSTPGASEINGKGNKRLKPPPINITDFNAKDTIKILENKLSQKEFHVKRTSNSKHIVYCESITDFKIAKESLDSNNVNYYTYTSKDEKKKTIVLKGLDASEREEEVLNELKSQNIPDVEIIKVTRLATEYSKREKSTLPIFLVQLSAESVSDNLTKIKYLNHQVIRWEILKKKTVLQCYNCQKLGHSSYNCHLPHRCVKCEENHERGECKVPSNETMNFEKIYCVNCKNFGHPASYRGCPIFIEAQKKIEEKNRKNHESQEKKTRQIHSYIQTNKSFAQATNDTKQALNTQYHENRGKTASNEYKQYSDIVPQGLEEFKNFFTQQMKYMQQQLDMLTTNYNNKKTINDSRTMNKNKTQK